jgi:pyruvate/2-oxoglutarate dehydrogenase complex dihydrolipoamide dehydrogenase (E3) component
MSSNSKRGMLLNKKNGAKVLVAEGLNYGGTCVNRV